MSAAPHCDLCAALVDPSIDRTECCDERVCYGDRKETWRDDESGTEIVVCCIAQAMSTFEQRGLPSHDITMVER